MGVDMELKGSKANHLGDDVIIISDVMNRFGQFVVIVMDKHGKLSEVNITDIIVDSSVYQEEWIPDWSKIKYDNLRMDDNGNWNSYQSENVYYHHHGEWLIKKDDECDFFNAESHIEYKHPNPSKSIYTRKR
jgi:hypothetical protein